MGSPASRRVSFFLLYPDHRHQPSEDLQLTHGRFYRSGGFATAIATSPLDVLRTRLQSDFYQRPPAPSSAASGAAATIPKHTSHKTARIISNIYQAEGWRAFFRGLGPSLAGVVPATAIKFYVYGNCKRIGAQLLGTGEDSILVHAQAAIAAGIATATATNPIWLVKTRLQLDKAQAATGTRRYKNSLDCIRQVLRQEGISGLYKGLSASYLGSLETALHLVLYERIKTTLHTSLGSPDGKETATQKEITSWLSTTGAAGSAKFAAALIAYPHEVRSRPPKSRVGVFTNHLTGHPNPTSSGTNGEWRP